MHVKYKSYNGKLRGKHPQALQEDVLQGVYLQSSLPIRENNATTLDNLEDYHRRRQKPMTVLVLTFPATSGICSTQ